MYKVQACTKSYGFVEFVPKSKTLEKINKEGGVEKYLDQCILKKLEKKTEKIKNKEDEIKEKQRIEKKLLENYV